MNQGSAINIICIDRSDCTFKSNIVKLNIPTAFEAKGLKVKMMTVKPQIRAIMPLESPKYHLNRTNHKNARNINTRLGPGWAKCPEKGRYPKYLDLLPAYFQPLQAALQ